MFSCLHPGFLEEPGEEGGILLRVPGITPRLPGSGTSTSQLSEALSRGGLSPAVNGGLAVNSGLASRISHSAMMWPLHSSLGSPAGSPASYNRSSDVHL